MRTPSRHPPQRLALSAGALHPDGSQARKKASRGASRCPRELICAVWLTAMMGCSRHPEPEGDNTAARRVEKVARNGPVMLTLSVTDDAPPFDARVWVRVEAVADAGVSVRIEDYLTAMEQQPFGYSASPTRSLDAEPFEGGRKRWMREYELTFFVPGEHVLPSARLTCLVPPEAAPSSTKEAPPGEQTLETEPIPLNVRPTEALSVSEEKLAELSTPAPVELREPPGPGRWWIAGAVTGAIFLAAGAAYLWWRRWSRPAPPLPPPPPDVWALGEIERLLAEGLIERGRVQEFYFRLSGIVRGFIERRFGLHAPEMTTEEFFQTALVATVLGADNRRTLGEFLAACDLVKFARFEPDREAIEQSVETARAYVRAMGAQAVHPGIMQGV